MERLHRVGVPNPEKLSMAEALARGRARFDACYREDPELAALLLLDTASVLMARSGGGMGEAINPLAVLSGLGCISEKDWPEALHHGRRSLGAWRDIDADIDAKAAEKAAAP